MSDLTDTLHYVLEVFEEVQMSDANVLTGLEKVIKAIRQGRAAQAAIDLAVKETPTLRH